MLKNLEAIQQLSNIAQNDMYLVISGTDQYTTGFPQLCNTIVSAIESILDPSGSIDIGDPPVQTFLKQALPALTEAFLRRNTLR